MIIKYEDIVEAINNYWNTSANLENIINSLSFDNLKTINVDKQSLIKNIQHFLFEKVKIIKRYEEMEQEEIYNIIINNKLDLINDQFFNFIVKIIQDKFNENQSYCLINYLKELRKIQVFNLYFKEEYLFKNKLELDYNDNTDYINKYNLDEDFIHIYDKKIINEILKEYDKGSKYRTLVKKYHPDLGFNDDEYIKIINDLKRQKIIS